MRHCLNNRVHNILGLHLFESGGRLKSLILFVGMASCIGASTAQSMPGMSMPGDPPPAQKKPAPAKVAPRTPAAKASPKKQALPEKPKPSMQGMEDMPGMHTDAPVPQSADGASITHATYAIQEPENPTQRTGKVLPAPELLTSVVGRRALMLEELLADADRTNPTLVQADNAARQSEARAGQAKLYPNPTIGYEGDQIRGGAYGGGEQGAFVQQTVVLGGKLGLRSQVYRQQSLADRVGIAEQRMRVRHDVSEAFYAALTAQAEIVVRQRLLGVALDAVETVHQLANVGQADAPDILQAEVESEQAKIDFVAAQREHLRGFARLAAACGRADSTVSPLAGSLEMPPTLDAEAQVVLAMQGSPEVKRAEAAVAVSEARLKAARREAMPDLQLRAGEQYSFEHLTDVPVRPVGPQSFASAGVEVPIFNRNQGTIKAAEAELEGARQEIVRRRLMVRSRVEPMVQDYRQAEFTVERYRTELIPRAQRAYQLYLGKYQAMAMAYPQVLVSQRTLFQLQIAYLRALREQWDAANGLQSFGLTGGLEGAGTAP